MLDHKGNKKFKCSQGKIRGGFYYYPPSEEWIGFGLNVINKYDGGNNDWLGKDGNKNEWAVAYHGIGIIIGSSFTLEKATNCIINEGFKAGQGQAYANYDDARHPGQKVGKGVYCSPDPNVMEGYARWAQTSTNVNGRKFMMGFMIRVKPDKIRYSESKKDYWVLNGDTSEMRPYRILIKDIHPKKPIWERILEISNEKVIKGDYYWSAFVRNKLLNDYDQKNDHVYHNVLEEAAIIGIDGVVWARTSGLNIQKEEINELIKLFKYFSGSFVKLAGKIFRVIYYIRDKLVYLKINEGGATISKTNKAFIIGIYNNTHQYCIDYKPKIQCIGMCNTVVENMANELRKVNY
jgi:profilin